MTTGTSVGLSFVRPRVSEAHAQHARKTVLHNSAQHTRSAREHEVFAAEALYRVSSTPNVHPYPDFPIPRSQPSTTVPVASSA